MSTTASQQPKFKIWWIIFGLALIFGGLFFWQLFGPDPAIVVSKETTFITAPLGEDGLPDYVKYFDEQARQGVTPENNAAVLIWQAMWPGELDPEYWLPMCAALGLEDVPDETKSLENYYSEEIRQQIADRLAKQFTKPEEMEEEVWQRKLLNVSAEEVIDEAQSRPWTSELVPELAAWVERNEAPLDLLVEASKRERYYSPSPSLLVGEDGSLMAMSIPDIQMARECLRSLQVRAMWHLGEGRQDEAWRDIITCHRLARLVAENSTMVGQLIAIAMDGVACGATQKLLEEELPEFLARQIFNELQAMPPLSNMAESMDQAERMMFLDAIVGLATHQEVVSNYIGFGNGGAIEPLDLLAHTKLDWNRVLRDGNRWYDRMAASLALPTRQERSEAFDEIANDLDQMSNLSQSPFAILQGILSHKKRTDLVSDVMLSIFLPMISSASDAVDSTRTELELTRVAAALAVYRARQGEYPAELADLVPSVFAEQPLDLYSGKPFHSERKPDGGYVLYSVYEDGVDDGGTHYSGEIIKGEWVDEEPEDFVLNYPEGDLVIRVPVPKFKMPEPPKADEWDEYGY